MARLEERLPDQPDILERACRVCARVDSLLRSKRGEPSIAKPAALLAGVALAVEQPGREGHPAGNSDLLKSEFIRNLLAEAGIAEQAAAKINELVRSVFSNHEREDAEFIIVCEAVRDVLINLSRRNRCRA
jgi:hypothetical protein